MTKNSKERDDAEANFKKTQKIMEGRKAMADYEAQGRAVREKTARLRALRLAKEVAEKATEAKNEPVAQIKKR